MSDQEGKEKIAFFCDLWLHTSIAENEKVKNEKLTVNFFGSNTHRHTHRRKKQKRKE